MTGPFGTYARRMRDDGLRVTPCNGKRPIWKDWRNRDPSDDEIKEYADCNVGLVLVNEIAIDADLDDEVVAAAVYEAVRNAVPKLREGPVKTAAPHGGPTLPRRVAGAEAGHRDVRRHGQGTEGRTARLGQQTVVVGTHPNTGKGYTYNGRGHLCELRRDDWPLLTAAQIDSAMAAARRAMLAAGLTETKPGTRAGEAQQTGTGSIRRLAEPLPRLESFDDAPKDLLDALQWADSDDYDSWIAVLHALKASAPAGGA